MRTILAIAIKDLRLISRDKEALFWVLAFPLMMAVLFGSIFSGMAKRKHKPIPIAVVDEDRSAASRSFVSRLKKQKSVACRTTTYAKARTAVLRGKLVAYVRIRAGYGSRQGFLTGDNTKVEVGIDPSKLTEQGFLQGIIMKATFGGLQDRMSDPQKTRSSVRESISALRANRADRDSNANLVAFLKSFDTYLGSVKGSDFKDQMNIAGPKIQPVKRAGKRPRTSFEVTFPQAVVWGLLGIIASFAVLIARERAVGTLIRLRISPASWLQILGGKGLAAFSACLASMALIFGVGIVLFSIRPGNPVQLAMAAVATACCVSGLMMLIATVGKTEQAVSGATWAIMMPLAMFGGGMLPLILMPGWMQTVSYASPVRWAVYAFEGAVWRELSPTEMLLPCAILVLTGAITFALGVTLLSRSRS